MSQAPAVLALAAGVLALIAPNHAPPWMFFVQETLAAVAFALLAVATLWRTRGAHSWRAPELLALALTIVVVVQYATGTILFRQSAWMPALYLLGLFLASQTGAALERRNPGQALSIVALTCLAAGLASVGLQAYQWLGAASAGDSIWVYRGSFGRPAANIGQPNLLATVQVIGLLGMHWLWRERRLAAVPALIGVALLLTGLAMTQSRTGLLNAWIVCLMLLAWNRHDRRQRWALPALGAVATALFVLYALFAGLFTPGTDGAMVSRAASAGTRPIAWRVFTTAIAEQPLAGYGWGQTFAAALAVAQGYPGLPEVWLYTHNLLLDLAVWNGLPIALAVAGAMSFWFVQCARRARDDGSRSLLLVIAVVLTHSMLEYPLAYAFLLLPFGLAAGALGERVQATVVWGAPRLATLALLVVALLSMALTVRDYFRVELSYQQLLLEKARIVVRGERSPPQVLVLTSLRDLIIFSRVEPAAGMPASELEWMAKVVRTHPGPHGFAKLARALALNGQATEAQWWIDRLCSVFTSVQCRQQADAWAASAEQVPALGFAQWPHELAR